MKSFIEVQFGYCQLIWMFHTRELNRKTNNIYELALRIVYRDNSSSFTELIKKDNSVCIHYRNIQSLAIEFYKVKHTISNSLILDIFPLRLVDYNLRTQTDFIKPTSHTTRYSQKSLYFFASKVWDMIPDEIKSSSTVEISKNKIRKWWPTDWLPHLSNLYFKNSLRKRSELSPYT